ncbi:MAG: Smr/MutS family protein [Gammaproteobacteria bacterium]|nr:Smr/MutS family protein [Gammaproteobacteria bacterium]
MSKDRKQTSTDDLFRQAVKDAQPLKQDRTSPYRKRRKPVPEKTREDEQEVMASLLSDGFEPADVETGDELLFQRGGIQNTVMRKLRRGQFAIEAELDLHRRTSEEARELLNQFLVVSQQSGYRCVRVIHGKGLGSEGRVPVLKNKINSWLRQKQEVLAFSSAIARDGGTGAVYVLLKKL